MWTDQRGERLAHRPFSRAAGTETCAVRPGQKCTRFTRKSEGVGLLENLGMSTKPWRPVWFGFFLSKILPHNAVQTPFSLGRGRLGPQAPCIVHQELRDTRPPLH